MDDTLKQTKKVDVVVIGSGIGGMCAAALLAHYGYRVLVAEKRARLGGRFSTQEIEGFKCPTGALIVQRGTDLEKTFQVTGAKFDVVPCSEVSWQLGDTIYPFTGKGRWRSLWALITKTPRKYYKFAFMVTLAVLQAMAGVLFRGFLNLFRKEENKIRPKREKKPITFRQWMARYTDDEHLMHAGHTFISALFSAVNDFECPASDVFAFAATQANPFKPLSFGYSRHGNIDLIHSLAQVVKNKGGEVLTETEVLGIKTKYMRAAGVVLKTKNGDIELDTQVVVSNAGPRETMEMVGEENLDLDYVRELKETVRPAPIVMGLIESDVPLLAHRGLVVPDNTSTIVGAVTLTLHTQQIAPPGKHLLWTFATPSTCTGKLDKRYEIKNNLEDLERAFPLFKEHGRVLKWEVKEIESDMPCMRAWPGYDMPVITPLKNLFNVGDGVKDFGWTGSPACARSAWKVVAKIRKQFQPVVGAL